MPPVDRVSGKDNQKRIISLENIVGKLNGSKKHFIPIAQISLLLTILFFAIKASTIMGEIKQLTTTNYHRITEVKLSLEEDISYLDMNGCKPSADNTKAIAVMGAK